MGDAAAAKRCDFFVSYTAADRAWAEWIAWQLEKEGLTTCLQAWDFRPGSSFPQEMHEALRRADRMIAVLSPAYLASQYATSEWQTMYRDDPLGTKRRLVPVRVEPCEPEALLGSFVWIDLVETDAQEAAAKLLAGIEVRRAKPPEEPRFPARDATARVELPQPPPFPNPEPQARSVAAPGPRTFDWVGGRWSAVTLEQTTWIVETRGSQLDFRRFGEHARTRSSDLGRPLANVAIAQDGTTVAVQVDGGLQLAGLNARGRLTAWAPCDAGEPPPTRLVAVRTDAAEATAELLIASSSATFSLAPRTGRPGRRHQVCTGPARCAASVGGAFLIVSSAGRIVRGTAPADAREDWVDIDCATGAGVELFAGIRCEGTERVLLAARHDGRDGELRQVTVPAESCRVRVARTPALREEPAQIVVELGGGELVAWSWDELATERPQP